ncbi:MAG: response regulator [Rhodospirillales bacterium]|nr:response regulator [Rhodospirillales bacterium]
MAGTDLSMLRVLVVDDQSTMRSIIRTLLKQVGIDKVDDAVNGEEALSWLKNPHAKYPDLIITDLYMDGMDGTELCNAIRRDVKLPSNLTPIIILTGDQDEMMHEVCRQLGAASVLTKPITGQELLEEIQTAIGYTTAA